jgi:5-methylcytosine-specific restriction endonuclease McrA
MGQMLSGENNPFWNRQHTPEMKEVMRQKKLGIPGKGGLKGYKHTPEARRKMSEAVRQRWIDQRDKMLSNLPRGEDHHFHKAPELLRHRKGFTDLQRREWTGQSCCYCGTTENLELDHIIPIFDGGMNIQGNAQTLCRHCNVWKTTFVDKPRYEAAKAIKGALKLSSDGS